MKETNGKFKPLRFSPVVRQDFDSILRRRVKAYFKENNISRYADVNMKIKTVLMLSLYFSPYILVMFGLIVNPWLIVLSWIIMGFGLAGVGMTIVHDANHGAYSKNKKVNYVLGRIVNVIGAYAPTWKVQHNVLHHTYTNIHHFDEDISPTFSILRFTPKDSYRPIHQFQYIYAWFFYSLMTLKWITIQDFIQLRKYKERGLIKEEKLNHLVIELIVSKVFYYFYMIILPIIVLNIPWWSVVLLLLLKHLVAGFTLSVIFILAHVVPETAFPSPSKELEIQNSIAIHQLETTSNFAPKSNILSWFIGGLNHQIEHHLFPNICHVHYKKLSVIVKQTAQEFDIPYYCERTFFSAVRSHKRMLHKLGEPSPENLAMAVHTAPVKA